MRTVDRSDGLALVGHAAVGPVRLATPLVLEARRPGEPAVGPRLEARDAPAGRRRLTLHGDGASVDLELPVIAPDVLGPGPGVYAAGPGTWMVHAPVPDEAWRTLRAASPELVILGNARALWAEGRPFVTTLRDLRRGVGAGPLLWTPRVALPHRVPFLVYAGVDVLDTTEGRIVAAAGTYLDPQLGALAVPTAASDLGCDCPGCTRSGSIDLDGHATAMFRRAIAESRAAARRGRLRELVEARTVSEPALGEMLRYADQELGSLLEERTPVTADGARGYVLAESLRRPEMRRFRSRLLERYRPPPSKEVLLLVPCSKTKPYRASRSHRRFLGALEGLRHLERVHVVSVSSPIGLVPRELEDVPPARHYDIPVTGDWSDAERDLVRTGLAHLLATGRYRRVLVHLDRGEYAFLDGAVPASFAPVWTVPDDRTTSAEALRSLRAAAEEAVAELRPVAGGPLAVVREELHELAAVQFGRTAADALWAGPLRLAGRPWFQRLTDGRTDLATVREERGLFHLTVAGARRLAPQFPLAVEVDPALSLEGDLFAPGVRGADSGIRAGDSVVLVRAGELAGVGEAVLPGPMMTELGRGLAVRVRHRAHASTDTTMTEGASRADEGPVVQR